MARISADEDPRRRGGGLRLAVRAAPWLGLAAVTALWARDRRQPPPGLSLPEAASPEHFESTEPGRGRLAEHPVHIPMLGWRDIAWRTVREISADRLPAVAGGVTFYALLAIFPGLGVFVSLYGLFADVSEVGRQLGQLAAFLPGEVLDIVGEQMIRLATQQHASLSIAFAVSLMISVWSANAGMQALFDGLNVAYDEEEKRSFARLRGLTLSFTVAALVFAMVVTAILVAVPIAMTLLGLGEDSVWVTPLRWLALLGIAWGAFATLYRFGPSRQQPRWRWVRWGAAFSALLWVAGSLGFSWYVDNVGHYNATYGSLATVVGFMMWIWFSTLVVLVGAELNAEIEHQTALDSTTGAPLPMGARGAAMADTVGVPFAGLHKLMDDAGRGARKLLRRKAAKR